MRSCMLVVLFSGAVLAQRPNDGTPEGAGPPEVPKVDPTQPPAVERGLRTYQRIPPVTPRPGSVEEVIATALRNHPDMKLAEARRMVADAELEQAKLALTQKITNAFAKVEQAEARARLAQKFHQQTVEQNKLGRTPAANMEKAESALQAAKSELAAAEADLLIVKGGVAHLAVNSANLLVNELLVQTFDKRYVTSLAAWKPTDKEAGSLRDLVGKKVQLDLKKVALHDGFEALLKAAGNTKLTVRLPDNAKQEIVKNPPLVGPQAGEMTFAAWVQLMIDDFNHSQLAEDRCEVFVREYGLLVTYTRMAPVNAPTLSEYVRMVQAEKAATKP